MTTAERLRNITDRALFERIANSVLRLKYPALSNLIEGGLNESGETVKGALDSFCNIGNNNFVFIEHTTNDSNLRAKWLYNRNSYTGKKKQADQPDGDLIKAIAEADNIRESITDAKITIYLTVNQNVTSDLWKEVVKVANDAGVNVEIVELKTIANFLNVNPTGQYLRKKLLGVDEELLSAELFLDIQEGLLNQYITETFIETNTVVTDWNLESLSTSISDSKHALTLIVAESGFGKSTLCFNYINSLITNSSYCLRLSPEDIAEAASPVKAIEKALKRYNTKLFFNEESTQLIIKLNPTIVVDDINKCNEPKKILDKLIAWGMGSDSLIKIICPIWPKYLMQLSDKAKKEGKFNYYNFGKPSNNVCNQIVKKWLKEHDILLSELQVNELVKNCDNDPLLINLSLNLAKPTNGGFANIGEEVIKSFVNDQMNVLPSSDVLPDVKKRLLIRELGLSLLLHKKTNPTYTEIIKWNKTNQDVVQLIDEISSNRGLFFFDDKDIIQYRHDRLRDYILSEGVTQALEDRGKFLDILSDPYFSRQVGYAIAEKNLEDEDLSELIKVAPQGVFNSLRYLQGADKFKKLEQIIEVITAWKTTDDFKNLHPNIIWAISVDLSSINTHFIDKVIAGFKGNTQLSAAQLRNGYSIGGMSFLMSYGEFEPSHGNPYRDLIIEHAKVHHEKLIVKQLVLLLETKKLDDPWLKGALLLAGYISNSKLVTPIINHWDKNKNEGLAHYYLWAIINCFDADTMDDAKQLWNYFNSLPDEGYEENGLSKGNRNKILSAFSYVRWQLSEIQIELIDKIYDEYAALFGVVLDRIDHPVAMKRSVDSLSLKLEKAHPESPFAMFYPNDKWDYERKKYRLSDATLSFLEGYWQDADNTNKQREVSFKYWSTNVEKAKILRLSGQVDKEDFLYPSILFSRVISGDLSSIGEYIDIIPKRHYWIRQIHYIWNDKTKQFYKLFFIENASKQNASDLLHDLTDVLRKIPNNDAAELLVEFWDDIKKDFFGVQTAIYIATPETLELAAKEVVNSENPHMLFRYTDQCYYCYNNEYEGRITIHKLNSLKPYFKYLEKVTLNTFAEQCLRLGYNIWLYRHLFNQLDEKDKIRYIPTATQLNLELREDIKHAREHFWLTNLERRNIKRGRILEGVKEFSKNITTAREFEVLSDIISKIGDRKDLRILEEVNFEGINQAKRKFIIDGAQYTVYNRTLI